MFEEEIKKLTPYERYVIFIPGFRNTYSFALYAYNEGSRKIEFEKTPHLECYLKNIEDWANKLNNEITVGKIFKSDIDEKTLDKFRKKEFNSYDDLFNKSQQLLDKMNNFLSKHNIELSI